jgi:PAS domain-containing protein
MAARPHRLDDSQLRRHSEEDFFPCQDGRVQWVRWSTKPWRTADGRIGGALLLASPLPIALYDDREEVLAISGSWLEQTGYSREELRRLEDWTTRAYQERSGEVLKYLRGIISTEPQGKLCDELTIRTKDDRERL